MLHCSSAAHEICCLTMLVDVHVPETNLCEVPIVGLATTTSKHAPRYPAAPAHGASHINIQQAM